MAPPMRASDAAERSRIASVSRSSASMPFAAPIACRSRRSAHVRKGRVELGRLQHEADVGGGNIGGEVRMARGVKKLSARAAASLARPGRHSDGAGLYLHVSKNGDSLRRRWIFRFSWQGRVCEMGSDPQTLCRSQPMGPCIRHLERHLRYQRSGRQTADRALSQRRGIPDPSALLGESDQSLKL